MPRAAPMPPEERRAALIAATEPLLEQFGRDVSTRRIAEAAGVAEGTIFRVFPTKESLVDAVCEQVVDLGRVCDEIERIDRGSDLETRLATAVGVMQRRLRRIFSLFHALRTGPRPSFDPDDGHRARQQHDTQRLTDALAGLLEPDADRLRMPVDEAANSLRLVTLAMTHPMLSHSVVGEHRPHDPAEIVDLVLHGIARPSAPTGPTAC